MQTAILPEFIEAGDHEKGFAQHFKEKIAPLLEGIEANRLAKYASFKKRLLASFPISALILAAGIGLMILTEDSEGDFIKIAFVLIGVVFVWAYNPIREYKQDVKSKFMPVICEFFGSMTYALTGFSTVEGQYRGDIFPTHTRAEFEDFIEGNYKQVQVKMHESKLTQKNGKHTVTVFQGFVLELEFPKEFKGKTLMLKDGGSVGNFFTGKDYKGLELVNLEDPEFENQFQVFSSDQVEARFVLTTAFMERLLKLARLRTPYGNTKVQCVFENKHLVIAIPCTQNLFEPGSIKRSALQVDDIHTFLEQMRQVFELVDTLKLTRI